MAKKSKKFSWDEKDIIVHKPEKKIKETLSSFIKKVKESESKNN